MFNWIKRFLKFGFVGILGVLVNLLMFALFRELLEIPDFLAKTFAIEISILHNFGWNFTWTWADRGRTWTTFWQRLIRYHGSTFVASFVVTIAFSYLSRLFVRLVDWEGSLSALPLIPDISQAQWVAYIAYLIGIAAGMIANFILSDRWVFIKQRDDEDNTPDDPEEPALG